MQKWEYKTFVSDEEPDAVLVHLNGIGDAYWELIAVTVARWTTEDDEPLDRYSYFFKRPKP